MNTLKSKTTSLNSSRSEKNMFLISQFLNNVLKYFAADYFAFLLENCKDKSKRQRSFRDCNS